MRLSRSIYALGLVALFVALSTGTGCSDSDDSGVSCGDGTVLQDGECVAAGTDSPEGSEAPGEFGSGESPDVIDDEKDTAEGDEGEDTVDPDSTVDPEDADGDGDAPGIPDALPNNQCDEDGAQECISETKLRVCIMGQWVEQECPGTLVCIEGFCAAIAGCEPGDLGDCINTTTQSVCDPEGLAFVPKECPEGQFCYQGVCGDQLCGAGEKTCISPTIVGICNEDGDGYEAVQDCGATQVCVGDECLSGCDGLIKFNLSYIGCEFWTADLDQYDDPFGDPKGADYGVVISNPGIIEVNVQFLASDGTAIAVDDPSVPPGQARQFVMPTWNVDHTSISKKAIQILTDFPVVVHQFNPLNNEDGVFGIGGPASNDASLLLPTHALGSEYYIMTWPSSPNPDILNIGIEPQMAYLTVIAVEEGETTVVVEASAYMREGEEIEAMLPGDVREFTLEQFDVLNIESMRDDVLIPFPADLDPTGTHVYSDKNIVVFSGHEEAVISPDNELTCCAEHLEEQMVPVKSWRSNFICAKTSPRGTTMIEPDLWRVLAAEDGTILNTNPPIAGLDGVTINRGEWVQAFTNLSFELDATAPIQVAQYTVAQEFTEFATGDPSLILAVPYQQYRDQYTILTPSNYTTDWCTVIRPADLPIIFDGNVLEDAWFEPVGTGAWEMAYVPVEAGVHSFGSTEPFGLVSYGWSSAVSYGFPGGMDLLGN